MNLEKCRETYGDVIWTGKKCILGMPISFTRYIITSSKLITRAGLLNINEDEIELYRVIDKTMNFPLSQRIFGCGSIKIVSKDSDTPVKLIASVKQPREVKRILDDTVQQQRDKYYVRGRDMTASAASENYFGDYDDNDNGDF